MPRSLMDMITAKSTEVASLPSESSTLVEAEPPHPIHARLRAAIDFMMKDILQSPETSNRAKFFIKKMMEEGFAELNDAPPEIVHDHFLQSTALMYWVSTGELIQNLPMPEGFWDFSATQIPNLVPPPLSLESGKNGNDDV